MSLSDNKKIVFIAEETTPGVSADFANAVAILAEDTISVTPVDAKTIERNTVKAWMGNTEKLISYIDSKVDIEIALSGSGAEGDSDSGGIPAPGTTPVYDVLFQAGLATRTTVASAITGTAQGGNKNVIKLASGASATNNAYTAMPVYVQVAAGTCQAPGSTSKFMLKLASGASATDDYYKGYAIRVNYFTGTVIDTANKNSTIRRIFIDPADVSNNNITGCNVEVTTGSNQSEIRRVKSFNKTSGELIFSALLTIEPTDASTFIISESKIISSSNGTSKVVVPTSALKFVTTTATTYEIAENRIAGAYDGTTKNLSVYPPLSVDSTNATTYIIGANTRYTPNSNTGDNQKSYTIWFIHDEQWHQLSFCKCNLSNTVANNKVPILKAAFLGVLSDYYVDTIPASSFLSWLKPLPVNFANTKMLNVHGFTDVVLEDFMFDFGSQVVHRNKPGKDHVFIADRKPTCSITLDKPTTDEFDYIDAIKTAQSNVVCFSHGESGNQLIYYVPHGQITGVDSANDNGIATAKFTINPKPGDSGGEEFYLTVC